jgi:hypothetical protein
VSWFCFDIIIIIIIIIIPMKRSIKQSNDTDDDDAFLYVRVPRALPRKARTASIGRKQEIMARLDGLMMHERGAFISTLSNDEYRDLESSVKTSQLILVVRFMATNAGVDAFFSESLEAMLKHPAFDETTTYDVLVEDEGFKTRAVKMTLVSYVYQKFGTRKNCGTQMCNQVIDAIEAAVGPQRRDRMRASRKSRAPLVSAAASSDIEFFKSAFNRGYTVHAAEAFRVVFVRLAAAERKVDLVKPVLGLIKFMRRVWSVIGSEFDITFTPMWRALDSMRLIGDDCLSAFEMVASEFSAEIKKAGGFSDSRTYDNGEDALMYLRPQDTFRDASGKYESALYHNGSLLLDGFVHPQSMRAALRLSRNKLTITPRVISLIAESAKDEGFAELACKVIASNERTKKHFVENFKWDDYLFELLNVHLIRALHFRCGISLEFDSGTWRSGCHVFDRFKLYGGYAMNISAEFVKLGLVLPWDVESWAIGGGLGSRNWCKVMTEPIIRTAVYAANKAALLYFGNLVTYFDVTVNIVRHMLPPIFLFAIDENHLYAIVRRALNRHHKFSKIMADVGIIVDSYGNSAPLHV